MNRVTDVIDRNLVAKRSCIVEIFVVITSFVTEWVDFTVRDFQSFYVTNSVSRTNF